MTQPRAELELASDEFQNGTVIAYDYMGRRFQKETWNSELGTTNRTQFVYDGWAMIRELVTQNSEPITNSHSYVPDSNLSAGYTITPGGAAALLTVSKTYEDHRNLLASVSNTVAGGSPALISAFGYENDAQGRRTKRVDDGNGLSVTNTFGYNIRSEVIEAVMPVLSGAEVGTNSFNYDFDQIGNRLASSSSVSSVSSVVDYLSNELNQYTNISGGAAASLPEYDDDGNLTSYSGWAFVWNGENRLVNASNATTVISNSYDYMGRRYCSVRSVSGVSTTNTFIYDGWAMIREHTHSQTHTLTNSYIYGLDLSGSMQGAGTIGGILTAMIDGTNVFYCYDANGNVTDLVDTNPAGGGTGATIVAHYEYGPFGQTTAKTGTLADANPFRFSTKYLDADVELYYYGLRYYNPTLGRWISRDPIEEEGGINVYTATGNSCVNLVDPIGLVVGTVSVTTFRERRSGALGFKKRGWWFTVVWRPPTDGGWEQPCPCKPCEEVLWIQDVYEIKDRYWPLSDIVTPWSTDWDEHTGYGDTDPWSCGPGGFDRASMGDGPWFGTFTLSTYRRVNFRAKSYAKCIKGREAGTVYATVYWGYDWVMDTISGVGPFVF